MTGLAMGVVVTIAATVQRCGSVPDNPRLKHAFESDFGVSRGIYICIWL